MPFVEAFDPSTDYGKAAGGAAGAVALAGALYSAATTSQAKVELEAKADQLSTELEASADKLKVHPPPNMQL